MPDSGEAALGTLLREMQPVLSPEAYTFSVVPTQARLPLNLRIFATVHEEEGVTIIGPESDIARAGLAASGSWARISLNIHSALSAVGLTAAVSGALAAAGISANVLAGHYHDHLFVPWERRHQAFAVLVKFATIAPNYE